MRAGTALAALIVMVFAANAVAQDGKGTRYGVEPDAKGFPQATAKEAFASVIKAIDDKKFDYLVAQLADPTFVDDRVKRLYGGKFDEQVQDSRSRFDPAAVKLLKRFLKEGKWTLTKSDAVVQLDDVKESPCPLR